jgi:hypothetical protein
MSMPPATPAAPDDRPTGCEVGSIDRPYHQPKSDPAIPPS